MSRSLYKGPYVDEKILNKIAKHKPADAVVFKTWSRDCVISPEMVGFIFGVHNGKTHIDVLATEDMVGHRLGEFSPTKTFRRHGGKMQKELDVKKKESEVAAAKAGKAAETTKAKAK
jgi:small subunit ribosomal protein S19